MTLQQDTERALRGELFPFISVILPVYNSEMMIAVCIDSVLAQDYPRAKYEIIVIDNGSKDRTLEIIKRYPVKCLVETETQSSYAARNRGVREAQGEILAFIDADCIADPKWLSNGVKSFEDENVGCVAGEIRAAAPESDVEKCLAEKNELSQTKTSSDFPFPYPKTANAFYRKQVFEKVGFFEQKWVSGGDADFAWRMQIETAYKLVFLPDALVYHKHRATLTKMFNQCFKWGVGYSFLAKKYSGHIKTRTVKQKIWILSRIFLTSAQVVFFRPFLRGMEWNAKKQYYDKIAFLGWELGRVVSVFV